MLYGLCGLLFFIIINYSVIVGDDDDYVGNDDVIVHFDFIFIFIFMLIMLCKRWRKLARFILLRVVNKFMLLLLLHLFYDKIICWNALIFCYILLFKCFILRQYNIY